MSLIRVKRRLQDDPIDLLFLNCKKPKTEDNPITKVFKFATTVQEQEIDLSSQITKAKDVQKHSIKCRENRITSITEKLRTENKLASQNNRFKVVNWYRTRGNEKKKNVDEDGFTIVDLETSNNTKSSIQNSEISSSLADDKYVYDLYYSAQGGDIDDLQMENLLSVYGVNEDLFCNEDEESDDQAEDEDDSNDENNWRNDYPDEDSDEGSSSDDSDTHLTRLSKQLQNVAVDDDDDEDMDEDDCSDLSSEDNDSLVLYSDHETNDLYYHSDTSRSESSFSYYSTD